MAEIENKTAQADRSAFEQGEKTATDLQNKQDELEERDDRRDPTLRRGTLDEALDDSFPASDPPAMTQPKGEKAGQD